MFKCACFRSASDREPGWRSVRLGAPVLFVALSFASFGVTAQAERAVARVTRPVNLHQLVTLHGNTHPLARPEYDHGAAPDGLPMNHMLLVLQRSSQQEVALQELLLEQQVKTSASYHQWLTPRLFGEQFGPADSDIQAVTTWLASQGFSIDEVAKGRTVIEFSGTAGMVRRALHTEIHKYVVNGKAHWANASDPQIPAALAPVVAGIASLNNFPRRPMLRRFGAFQRSKITGKVTPLFTFTSAGQTLHALGPTDFATIYNLQPLWKAGTDGTGQTIAVVGESDIEIQDVRDFRNLFGLPANDPQFIVNGPDPGIVSGDETESDLDVEWAGAVAKNATIDLVISETTETSAGIDLSALYIIDNNLAPVMSESYGDCEAFLGVAGNALYKTLWEQAAAQGITVLMAAGDAGSAGCDTGLGENAAQYGVAVSGFASTPFDVAVGGTDFNDPTTSSQYWNAKNTSTSQSSALSYIPETTWNDSCAQSGGNNCLTVATNGQDLAAGGGGPSTCGTLTGNDPNATCVKGYAKPAWQTGSGVPNDGARDTPDISMFAGDGSNGTFYIVCAADTNPNPGTSCDLNAPYQDFQAVGGTSASTQVLAGIMALVNQKTGQRQGNANYVLYKLAAQSGASCASDSSAVDKTSCIFYDIVTGNDSVACLAGSPDCSNTGLGSFGVEVNPSNGNARAWTTTSGYDLATGLGAVNAANLVNNWSSVSFTPSTTTINSLSPTTVLHGQPVNVTIQVSAQNGTPTGSVSLIGGPNNAPLGIADFKLSSGTASGATSLLPGGTYTVTAHYRGDGNFGASDSAPPIQVTVNPESSKTQLGIVAFDLNGNVISSNATALTYGSPYVLRVNVSNSAGASCGSNGLPVSGCPTGKISVTDSGKPLDLGNYTLNNLGYLEDQFIQFAAGSHTLMASYAGDSSFSGSTSSADPVSVARAGTGLTLSASPTPAEAGSAVALTAIVSTQSNGAAPGGAIQFLHGSTPLSGTVSYVPTAGSMTAIAQLQATLSVVLPATENITAAYAGDPNYTSSTSAPLTVTVAPGFSFSASPTSLSISAPGQSASSALTVTYGGGFTNAVSFSCQIPATMQGSRCSFSPSSLTTSGTATMMITTTAPGTGAGLFGNFDWHFAGGACLLACLLLAGMVVIRRRFSWAFAALLVVLVAATFASCGSGSGSTSSPPSNPATSAGSYSVSVTATGGTIARNATIAVTVQ
jgi:Pro-kumamolisin, activation domain/Bacterial Ig-like domain (group 3)